MSSSTAASIGPPQPPPPPTSPEEGGWLEKCLNLELWHACSSPLVCLPSVGTRVVYFPQGHSEQVSWLSAMGCSLLVSMVSLVCLVLLQSRGNHQRPWWIALPSSWS
ncbi:auxin response factor 12 isoform X1 [Oryza sativa Japonica Group]|uniref:auxin response factor 12 isoform X1 n=1 Tax=Oryza sativa subsp. japonica TaxID=39947 RepID=UPI0007754A7D